MSNSNIYQEIFDTHQDYFKTYLKNFSPKDTKKLSNFRLSYINFMADVKFKLYNNKYL